MIIWEPLERSGKYEPALKRSKVPGGWLVYFWDGNTGALTFYPDPYHEWDGSSLY